MQFLLIGDDTDFGLGHTNEVRTLMEALAEYRRGNEDIRLVNEDGLRRMWIKHPGEIEEEDNYLIAAYKKHHGIAYGLSEAKRNELLTTQEGMKELLSLPRVKGRFIDLCLNVIKWHNMEMDAPKPDDWYMAMPRREGQKERFDGLRRRWFSSDLVNPRLLLELECELHLLKHEVRKLYLGLRNEDLEIDRDSEYYQGPKPIDNTELSKRLWAILEPLNGLELLFAKAVLEYYDFLFFKSGDVMSHEFLSSGSLISGLGDSGFYLPLE